MAELSVPERHKSGLIKLLRLSDRSVDQIISAFEGVAPKFIPEELAAAAIPKVEGISSNDFLEIINAVLSLSQHRVHDDTPPEELAGQVFRALLEAGIDDKSLLRESEQSFRQRLVRFFELETLLISAKAAGILQSHENLFCSARILTDVRPVFGSDPRVVPNSAVIVHMLNLSFHHEGEIKELYIAMDTLDIGLLREALDRAELKSESLKTLMKRAGVTRLDPGD
jgi:hypothetical protein